MKDFTKEELRWILKVVLAKRSSAVGLPLLTKLFEIERKINLQLQQIKPK